MAQDPQLAQEPKQRLVLGSDRIVRKMDTKNGMHLSTSHLRENEFVRIRCELCTSVLEMRNTCGTTQNKSSSQVWKLGGLQFKVVICYAGWVMSHRKIALSRGKVVLPIYDKEQSQSDP